jgi:hypothetical protein
VIESIWVVAEWNPIQASKLCRSVRLVVGEVWFGKRRIEGRCPTRVQVGRLSLLGCTGLFHVRIPTARPVGSWRIQTRVMSVIAATSDRQPSSTRTYSLAPALGQPPLFTFTVCSPEGFDVNGSRALRREHPPVGLSTTPLTAARAVTPHTRCPAGRLV